MCVFPAHRDAGRSVFIIVLGLGLGLGQAVCDDLYLDCFCQQCSEEGRARGVLRAEISR